MLPAAANAAVYALTELFPGSSAVICRAAADRPGSSGRRPRAAWPGRHKQGQLTSQAGLASGFTLLELLVVMTVIGLMLASSRRATSRTSASRRSSSRAHRSKSSTRR